MKTSQDIIETIMDAGVITAEDILQVLLDGEALAKLGITDDDQEAVEDAFAYVSQPDY